MLRRLVALALAGCLASCVHAGGAADGTVIAVSKTGFVLQTKKGPKKLKFADFQMKGTPSPDGETFERLYHLRPADLLEGMEVYVRYHTPTPDREWICKGIRPKHAELNFEPFAKADRKFTLQLVLVARDGTKLKQTCEIEKGASVEAVRDKVLRSMQPIPPPKDHWKVFGRGTDYLEIVGYVKDGKFILIEKVEVSSPDLKWAELPRVRPYNKPWPTQAEAYENWRRQSEK